MNRVHARSFGLWGALAVLVGALSAPAAQAQIFSCVAANGRKITSDRPIPECADREQRLHNADGSVRQRILPHMTAAERERQQSALSKQQAEDEAKRDAQRVDRNLLSRYPDEAAHVLARQRTLGPLETHLATSTQRLAELDKVVAALHKRQQAEGALPELVRGIEAAQARYAVQAAAHHNLQGEYERTAAAFDDELTRLRLLWNGAVPGSLGPLRAPRKP